MIKSEPVVVKSEPVDSRDEIDSGSDSNSDDDIDSVDDGQDAFVPRLLEMIKVCKLGQRNKMACFVPVSCDEKVFGIPLDQAADKLGCEKLLQGPVTTFDISCRTVLRKCRQQRCSERQLDDIDMWASEMVVVTSERNKVLLGEANVNYMAWWLKGHCWACVRGSIIVLPRKAWESKSSH